MPADLQSSRSQAARRRALIGLAARAVRSPEAARGASGSAPTSRTALARARASGVPRHALSELGLMLPLYAGFPAAIEFLRELEEVWPRASDGRTARAATRTGSYASWPRWQSRGETLCRRVYGPGYAKLRAFMRGLAPDLDRWMIVEGYGRTLSRPGLSLLERELVAVASLAALGWWRQLDAHRRGALRLGASAAEVRAAERAGRRRAAGAPTGRT